MPDPFRLLNPGDSLGPGDGPFNSQWHNAVTESVRVTQRNTAPGVTAKSIDTDKGGERWYANISEANVDQFVAVGLGDLAIPPDTNGEFRERVVFYTADLAADEPFGITQEPVGAGELFICKTNTGPGGQPPSADWVRMLGDVAAYNGSTDYTVGMRVSQSGSDYVCIAATTGNAPPNASYWVLEGTHQGPWMLADSYVAGDVIVVPPLGKLKVSGDSPVWLDVTDEDHKYAGVVAGVLESVATGPLLILWREGGTGEQWAVVRFDDDGHPPVGFTYFPGATPTTWTCPDDVTEIWVECWGGGGAGGRNGADDGGGGGGGAYAASLLAVVPGTVYTLFRGAGGDTGSPGAAPEDSWFSLTGSIPTSSAEGVLAKAGANGGATLGGAGGAAVSCYGDVAWSGGDGGDASGVYGGCGGGSGFSNTNGEDGDDGWAGFPTPKSGQGSGRGGSPYGNNGDGNSDAGFSPGGGSSNWESGAHGFIQITWGYGKTVHAINLRRGLIELVGDDGIEVKDHLGETILIGLSDLTARWILASAPPTATPRSATNQIVLDKANGIIYTFNGVTWDAVISGVPSIPVPVASGGTGATSFTSSSLIVGNGTSALSAVATTRVSGGNLQIKLASDSWIEFGEASF